MNVILIISRIQMVNWLLKQQIDSDTIIARTIIENLSTYKF